MHDEYLCKLQNTILTLKPISMKALLFEQPGKPLEVLQIKNMEQPTPGKGEVLVKVHKANIIPADIMFIQGMYGLQPELPQIAGFEATGRIEKIGDEVPLPVGIDVIFTASGTWAEYVCVDARSVIPKPKEMPDKVACQAFVNPLTAFGMLRESALETGDWLLLTAANSAFSKLVIQLAVERDIHVIGTVRSDDQKQALLELGAKHVINSETENIYKSVKRVTEGAFIKAAFDAVGGALGDQVLNVLQANGQLFVYGALSLKPIPVNSGLMIFKNLRIKGFWLSNWLMSLSKEERSEVIPKVLDLLTHQSLKTHVEAEYELEDFAKAIAHMEKPGRNGKILFNF